MYVGVYLPLVFSSAFGLVAPRLARRLPPPVATWLLTIGGLGAAAGTAATLAMTGATLIGQNPSVAARGHWSGAALRHADPVWPPVAAVASVALVALTANFALVAVRRLRALRAAYRLASALTSPGGELVVIDAADPQAYAVPGRPGRIVVSTALLRDLAAPQRRAVLAHERAHLRHRHHLHQTIAHLVAAANPVLRTLPTAVTLLTERWADEDASTICPRSTVASALSLAAMRTREPLRSAAVLAVADTDVTARVHALHLPAPRLQLWPVALMAGLLGAVALTTLLAAHDTDRLFDFAQYAYHVSHR